MFVKAEAQQDGVCSVERISAEENFLQEDTTISSRLRKKFPDDS